MHCIRQYTAIYGDKDELSKTPSIDGVKTILFTDRVKVSKGWDVRINLGTLKSNNLNAKQYKISPHKFLSEYDLTIWVDGNVGFRDVKTFIDKFKNNDMVVFDHNYSEDKRNCVYDEAKAIIKTKKR